MKDPTHLYYLIVGLDIINKPTHDQRHFRVWDPFGMPQSEDLMYNVKAFDGVCCQ